jgi:hypothetical protein
MTNMMNREHCRIMNKKNGLAIILLGVSHALCCTQQRTTPVKQNLPAHTMRSAIDNSKKQKKEQASQTRTTWWRRTLGVVGVTAGGAFLIKHFQLHKAPERDRLFSQMKYWGKHLFSPHPILPQNQENPDSGNNSQSFPGNGGSGGKNGGKQVVFGPSTTGVIASVSPEISSIAVTHNITHNSMSSSASSSSHSESLVSDSQIKTTPSRSSNVQQSADDTTQPVLVFCELSSIHGKANLSSEKDIVQVDCRGNRKQPPIFETYRHRLIRIRESYQTGDPQKWSCGQKVLRWRGGPENPKLFIGTAYRGSLLGKIVGVIDKESLAPLIIVYNANTEITEAIPFPSERPDLSAKVHYSIDSEKSS